MRRSSCLRPRIRAGSDSRGHRGGGAVVGGHLLGDFATHGGVPWLWPFKKRFSLPLTFRSGSWFERMLFFAFGTGTLYLLILRFAPWALHDALALWQQLSA